MNFSSGRWRSGSLKSHPWGVLTMLTSYLKSDNRMRREIYLIKAIPNRHLVCPLTLPNQLILRPPRRIPPNKKKTQKNSCANALKIGICTPSTASTISPTSTSINISNRFGSCSSIPRYFNSAKYSTYLYFTLTGGPVGAIPDIRIARLKSGVEVLICIAIGRSVSALE